MIRAALVGLVRAYQLLLSPMIGGSCRFTPTCSAYAILALQKHGSVTGTYLAVARIARCGPWCRGGNDPMPLEKPRLFTHLLSPLSKKKSS